MDKNSNTYRCYLKVIQTMVLLNHSHAFSKILYRVVKNYSYFTGNEVGRQYFFILIFILVYGKDLNNVGVLQ